MRFDAYAGNIAGTSPDEVAQVLAHGLSASIERVRPRGRYREVFEVRHGGDQLGWVGRDEQLQTAFFEFKGSTTPGAVDAIRRHWSDRHTVSRLDACEDYDDAAAFTRLARIVDETADPRVQSHQIAPRRGADLGRTFYWGSSQSRLMARLYEAGKMRDRLHYGRPNWVRLEAQGRPGKAAEKALAARFSPLDVWGLSNWSRLVAERVTHVEVQRFAPEVTPQTFEKTTLYLARAFRRHLEQLRDDHGDWQCVGREFEAIWKADDEAQEATASAVARSRAHDAR